MLLLWFPWLFDNVSVSQFDHFHAHAFLKLEANLIAVQK